MYPNFAISYLIWVTHLVSVVVWKKQLELESDVLGFEELSPILGYHIISREDLQGLCTACFDIYETQTWATLKEVNLKSYGMIESKSWNY